MALFLVFLGVLTGGWLASAQVLPAGTWEVAETAATPRWSIFLKPDAGGLTGVVTRCASPQAATVRIHDARLEGTRITFKCTNPNRTRVISFQGEIVGDEIRLAWEPQVVPGQRDNVVDRMFGPEAPRRFIVKRIADGDLALAANQTWGSEFVAALNLRGKDTKAEAAVFLPEGVATVRVVITTVDYGNGRYIYDAPEWRKLAANLGGALVRVRFSSIANAQAGMAGVNSREGGADVLVGILDLLSTESGHPEIGTAPLVLWGHSAGGGVAGLLAGAKPDRTLAFIRYQSGPISGDLSVVGKIPSLLVAGGKDTTARPAVAENLWKQGRAAGAPWTFAVVANAEHGEPAFLEPAYDLMTKWVAGVVSQRLPSGATTLQPVGDRSAWFGNIATGVIGDAVSFAGPVPESNWLPDEQTARAWRALHASSR